MTDIVNYLDSDLLEEVEKLEENKNQTILSNGFELRHVDLNLANRVYRSFPDFPVNNEVLKEILDNFEDEKGALITPNRPYMSKTAIL